MHTVTELNNQIISNSLEAATHARFYDRFWQIEQLGVGGFEVLRGEYVKAMIAKHLPSTANLNILDIGCGFGWLSSFVSEQGHYIGVDYSEKAINYAKFVFQAHGTFYVADPEDVYLGLQERNFDVIVATEVIEHIQDQAAFIDQLSLFLRTNGILIITTPNGLLYKTFFRKYGERMQPIEHWLTPLRLDELLHSKGFQTLSHEGALYRKPVYGVRARLISIRLDNLFRQIGMHPLYKKILLNACVYQFAVYQKTGE